MRLISVPLLYPMILSAISTLARPMEPALMVSTSVPASSSFHPSLLLRRSQTTPRFHSLSKCHARPRQRASFVSAFRSKWKPPACLKEPDRITKDDLLKDVRLPCQNMPLPQCKETAVNPQLGNMLGIAFLAGLLLFQGSNTAMASDDIGVGQQPMAFLGDLSDISTGFASAFLLIFFSELGDKTFFIAALLAARNSGTVVFLGTFGALTAMTIVSVVLGRAFHYIDGIIPLRFGESDFPVDDFAAACLLVYFGVTTLLDAASGDNQKIKEEQEEAELAISKFGGNEAGIMTAASTVISTFVLVFVAEWGDKSFFSTIALAAASSPLGVIGGTLAGHALATLIAVLGGSLLGKILSEKAIAYVGGTLFLVFAAVTLIEIVR